MTLPFLKSNAWRLKDGWLRENTALDPSKKISFKFDGKTYYGLKGDSLASALIANQVSLMGRSFKYHRPRGLLAMGEEEPNALITIGEDSVDQKFSRREANTRASQIELTEGLVARSQNAYPSLHLDMQSINQYFETFLAAGFYYKTFMGPFRNTKIWMQFEKVIRRAAGLGVAATLPDPDHYDHVNHYCDLLVVGAGRSGIKAAIEAAKLNLKVMLIDQSVEAGGSILCDSGLINGKSARDYLREQVAEMAKYPNLKVLYQTTAFGAYDQKMVCLLEKKASTHLNDKPSLVERLWWVRAKNVTLATGLIEQPLLFAGNDRPGVMLAGAVRSLANRYGVIAGKRVVVACLQDEAWNTAFDLARAGAEIVAIVDERPLSEISEVLLEAAGQLGIHLFPSHHIYEAKLGGFGFKAHVGSVSIADQAGNLVKSFDCDLVAMSGGWQPNLSLYSQAGGKLVWQKDRLCFFAKDQSSPFQLVGSVKGDGARTTPHANYIKARLADYANGKRYFKGKAFLDFQNDVGLDDIKLAIQEGYDRPELLKRYTTLSMATDQGKTGIINSILAQAAIQGKDEIEIAHTTFRPPYVPVSIGALTGEKVGEHFTPLRRTAMDMLHARAGAKWIFNGAWRRARYYPQGNEGLFEAYVRETQLTRNGVGIADVSTLGKIDIQGPDAGKFLDLIYTNLFSTLKIGRVRYGLMLRGDGFVMDDGTTTRLGENHYLMTTTTANAGKVMGFMELYLKRNCPDYKVRMTSVTDQWSAIAVAGPSSRELLSRIVELDLSNEAFPFMSASEARIAGIDGRIFRISFSGELAYELMVPADYGPALWERLLATGQDLNVGQYGLEALANMRIEKGHVAGAELNGRTSAHDLGLGGFLSKKKNFIGKALALRPDLISPDRMRLVGVLPVDGKSSLPIGAHLISEEISNGKLEHKIYDSLGYVTSFGYSPELNSPVAQALVIGGLERYEGKILTLANPIQENYTKVKIVSQHFIDKEGVRQNG